MIAIINTGEHDEEGRFRYRLQINNLVFAEFYHHRLDGLAHCLRLAADAADRAHYEKIDKVLKHAKEKPNDA